MKLKLLAAVIASTFAVAAAPAFAGAVADSDLVINSLGLVDSLGNPAPLNTVTFLTDNRTGTAAASYNGVDATGSGPSSINTTTVGATVDVKYRCAGDCPTASSLYTGGGGFENNLTTHVAPPPSANYALGDMLISGTALGPSSSGGITGLTRADASATGPTNSGGSNATILNSAAVQATFKVGTTFTGSIAVGAVAFLQAWVNPLLGTASTATAGMGFILSISSSDDAGFGQLFFTPAQLNKSFLSITSADNNVFNFAGTLLSDTRTFHAGDTYNISINQSSNASVSAVSTVPEPASIALIGAALVGLAVSTRRRVK